MDAMFLPTTKFQRTTSASRLTLREKQGGAEKRTEFSSHLHYTAATCDPDDFTTANGYSLRIKSAEILIVITAFNEDVSMHARTLEGVFANIQDICTSSRSKYWRNCVEDGDPASKRITVTLVMDGIDEMGEGVADFLAGIGVFQRDLLRRQVGERDTVAHIFESVISAGRLETEDFPNAVPVQFILVIKARNQKKLNSHRWILNGVGRILNPEICVLIDTGTKPGPQAIYHLWKAFYNDPHLGGACGEQHPMGGRLLLNPLVAAQNFEYRMTNILDKPLESTFGYVTVLPGSYSAYRYRAIQGTPLEAYFKGDQSLYLRSGDVGMQDLSIFQKTMFLTEDRILCFELVVKRGEKWTASFVKDSSAETDAPESAAEFIAQRRRWLNGGLATTIYALINFPRIYHTAHGWRRLGLYHVQAVYNLVSLVFSWFGLANIWLWFSFGLDTMSSEAPTQHAFSVRVFNWTLKVLYLAFLTLQVILAFGNRPKSERVAYNITMWIYPSLLIYIMFFPLLLCYFSLNLPNGPSASQLVQEKMLKSLSTPWRYTIGISGLISLLYLEPWHLMHSAFQYVCLAPSYTNVLSVYAYCNLHDVSWGTKGFDKLEMVTPSRFAQSHNPRRERQELNRITAMEDKYKTFRTRVLGLWLLCNVLLVLAVENYEGWLDLGDPSLTWQGIQLFHARQFQGRKTYISALLYTTYLLVLVRFVGSLIYLGRCHVQALGRWRRYKA